ncbi:MAG: hypothetical protein RJA63_3392 [Pseudomonadota bacterium]|jgi:hypothetical protein|nr:hypothetical protein [Uliginosibacterium sp.]
MHPIHDADVLVLLALAVASKRRHASLDEFVLGLATLQPQMPGVTRLCAAFARLSSHGLISCEAEAFALSAEAQKLMIGVPRKAETAEQIFSLKAKLAAFEGSASVAAFQPDEQALAAAIAAWQAAQPPLTKSDKFALRKGLPLGEKPKKRAWIPGGPRRRED